MRDSVFVLAAATLSAALAACAPALALAAPARSASEICGATADPCVVSQPIEVSGAIDFALRTLRVEGAGVIESTGESVEIACGRLELRTSGAAVRVHGGGNLAILVHRACSLAPRVACLTDADCVAAGAGECRAGDGSASIDGAVVADGDTAGSILLRAAAEAVVRRPVTARGTRAEADGGSVEVESTTGSVSIEAVIDVSGGGAAGGGDVDLLAAGDLVVRAPLRATGGEYDGGQVWLAAGRDVLVLDDLSASAAAGAGFGGAVVVEAGRDAVFDGGTATNAVAVEADGHQSAENFGGDGGTIDVEAARDFTATRHVRFAASGAAPDGFADALSFRADAALRFDATVVAAGRGLEGGGAIVDLAAGAAMTVSSSASFDLAGAAVGGDLALEAGGALEFAGRTDVTSSPSGVAGRILAIAADDAIVSGQWTTAGGASSFSAGELYLEGCDAGVTGSLSNAAESGRTTIVARESAHVAATASIVAGAAATNTIRYRAPDAPPIVDGVVRPAPAIVVDEALAPCSGCASAIGCLEAPLCRDLCASSHCSASALLEPDLVLRAARDGTNGVVWKGEIPAPPFPLAQAEVRILIAAADLAPLVDATLPPGSLRPAGAGWRLGSAGDAAPVRKAVLRRGRADGLLRARFKLAVPAGPVASEDALALALVVSEAAADDGSTVGETPCAESALLACERTRRRTACTSAP